MLKGAQRAEYYWEGPRGTGAKLASALRGWEHLRYEVTEDAGLGTDGGRPGLQRGSPRKVWAIASGMSARCITSTSDISIRRSMSWCFPRVSRVCP